MTTTLHYNATHFGRRQPTIRRGRFRLQKYAPSQGLAAFLHTNRNTHQRELANAILHTRFKRFAHPKRGDCLTHYLSPPQAAQSPPEHTAWLRHVQKGLPFGGLEKRQTALLKIYNLRVLFSTQNYSSKPLCRSVLSTSECRNML